MTAHVRVFGPNLSELALQDGQFHVHAEGWPDIGTTDPTVSSAALMTTATG